MPTYDYVCKRCGHEWELFQPITAKAKRRIKTECEQCNNSAPVTRLIGRGAGVIFKGSGFYQTDYRSDGYKKDAKKEKEAASGKKKDTDAKKSTDKNKDQKASGGSDSSTKK